MRKENSTNTLNEKLILDGCGMANTLKIIGGRWKPAILCRLRHTTMRYSELKKSIEGVSERMLAAQLKELEHDRIIERTVHPAVPPHVEYSMSPLGRSLEPVLKAMSEWGNLHRLETITEKESMA